jgi:hypothetical protein
LFLASFSISANAMRLAIKPKSERGEPDGTTGFNLRCDQDPKPIELAALREEVQRKQVQCRCDLSNAELDRKLKKKGLESRCGDSPIPDFQAGPVRG